MIANTVPKAIETIGTKTEPIKFDIMRFRRALIPPIIDQTTSNIKIKPSTKCNCLSSTAPITNKTGLNTAHIHTILIPLVRRNVARLFIVLFHYHT